jgi:hypothetical protein
MAPERPRGSSWLSVGHTVEVKVSKSHWYPCEIVELNNPPNPTSIKVTWDGWAKKYNCTVNVAREVRPRRDINEMLMENAEKVHRSRVGAVVVDDEVLYEVESISKKIMRGRKHTPTYASRLASPALSAARSHGARSHPRPSGDPSTLWPAREGLFASPCSPTDSFWCAGHCSRSYATDRARQLPACAPETARAAPRCVRLASVGAHGVPRRGRRPLSAVSALWVADGGDPGGYRYLRFVARTPVCGALRLAVVLPGALSRRARAHTDARGPIRCCVERGRGSGVSRN